MQNSFSRSILVSFIIRTCKQLLVASLLISTSVNAQTSTLQQLAQKELTHNGSIDNKSKRSISDATISGALTLSDPKIEAVDRSYKYSLAMGIQQMQINGLATNDVNQTFRFNKVLNTAKVNLGFNKILITTSDFILTTGTDASLAYGYTSNPTTLASSYNISDAKLNAYLANLTPYLGVRTKWLPKFNLELGAQFGIVNVFQSSSNQYANFSTESKTTGFAQRVTYKLTPSWSILAEINQTKTTTSNSGSNKLNIGNNSMIGVRTLW